MTDGNDMDHGPGETPNEQKGIAPTEEEIEDLEVSEVDTSDVRGGAATHWRGG